MTRSVLASVNGQIWDMHRPLTADCELKFLHFKDEDSSICNEVMHVCCLIVLFGHAILWTYIVMQLIIMFVRTAECWAICHVSLVMLSHG